jgi:hypothetical protein
MSYFLVQIRWWVTGWGCLDCKQIFLLAITSILLRMKTFTLNEWFEISLRFSAYEIRPIWSSISRTWKTLVGKTSFFIYMLVWEIGSRLCKKHWKIVVFLSKVCLEWNKVISSKLHIHKIQWEPKVYPAPKLYPFPASPIISCLKIWLSWLFFHLTQLLDVIHLVCKGKINFLNF